MQFAGRLQGNTSRCFFNVLTGLWNQRRAWECKPFAAVALPFSATRKILQPVRRISLLTRGSARLNGYRTFKIFPPMLATVAGHVHGQLEAAPDSQLVEGAAQVILDDLLRSAQELANFAVGEALPN
jgi:hypothetical protein